MLAGVLTALVLDQTLKRVRLPLDRPNERSLHTAPTPRCGGLVATPIVLVLWIALLPAVPWPVWIACALLYAVSALDDVRSLPVAARFAAHLAAAALVIGGIADPDWHWATLVVTTLGIGWMTNLYNFMDGSDGLAGGMALIGFGAYAIAAAFAGDAGLAVAAGILAGAALGFLIWNFPPARVFLGDAGSIPFGGMAGALGILGCVRDLWPAWFPVLVFSPFILDATITLVRRALRGERVWQAHREHYYQRLVRLGWSHKRTAIAEYTLMLACAGCALVALMLDAPTKTALLLAVVALYAALMVRIDMAWRRRACEV